MPDPDDRAVPEELVPGVLVPELLPPTEVLLGSRPTLVGTPGATPLRMPPPIEPPAAPDMPGEPAAALPTDPPPPADPEPPAPPPPVPWAKAFSGNNVNPSKKIAAALVGMSASSEIGFANNRAELAHVPASTTKKARSERYLAHNVGCLALVADAGFKWRSINEE